MTLIVTNSPTQQQVTLRALTRVHNTVYSRLHVISGHTWRKMSIIFFFCAQLCAPGCSVGAALGTWLTALLERRCRSWPRSAHASSCHARTIGQGSSEVMVVVVGGGPILINSWDQMTCTQFYLSCYSKRGQHTYTQPAPGFTSVTLIRFFCMYFIPQYNIPNFRKYYIPATRTQLLLYWVICRNDAYH